MISQIALGRRSCHDRRMWNVPEESRLSHVQSAGNRVVSYTWQIIPNLMSFADSSYEA